MEMSSFSPNMSLSEYGFLPCVRGLFDMSLLLSVARLVPGGARAWPGAGPSVSGYELCFLI